MTIYYSKSTAGFYDSNINTVIPGDSVEITSEEHIALLTAQSEGKVITVGSDGKPVATDPPKVSLDEYKTLAKAKIDVDRKATEEAGLSYVFPDGDTDVVQMRNTRDLLNVSSLVTSSQILKASGFTGTIPFQGESNNTHEMTADQVITMGLATSAYIQTLYAKAWPIKAAIDAAADYDAVDTVAVWPAD